MLLANVIASAYQPPATGGAARFGNEELPPGADTNLPGSDGRAYFTRFELTEAGSLEHVGVYSPVSGAGLIKGLVYEDDSGAPGALVAVGAAVNTATVGWHISACAGQALTPGFYWLGSIHFDFQSASFCNPSTGTGWAQFGDSNYASPPDPWSGGGAASYNVAVYAEYST